MANRRGFGRFARRILSAFAPMAAARGHEVVVAVDSPSAGSVEIPGAATPLVVGLRAAPSAAASAGGRRGVLDMLAMGRAVSRARLDLMYFPATYSFYPVWNVPRVVVTMHDTLTMEHPELVFPSWKGRLAWSLKEAVAVRSADRIVTVSETSRRYLLSRLRCGPDRLRVVSEAADSIFGPIVDEARATAALARYGVPAGARYVLYVGGLSPHKNLPRLVEAFAKAAGPADLLVLTGDFHDVFHTHVPEIRAAIARVGLEDRVVLTGFVPDEDLAALYGRAHALAFPSLLEGFGLPAVEAMACGCPVAASRAGSLPEVVGDAGILFDPLDVDDIARGLGELLHDPARRDELSALALRRASTFDWDRSAATLLACVEEFDRGERRSRRRPGFLDPASRGDDRGCKESARSGIVKAGRQDDDCPG
ncbi:glycosyltransferase family 1 protein [Paludisphaera sp.]|uniref:glycosyltransferase family 4 protein n=1 Tax=Paludisphaera sp. TaxID=2017432 RepID=UPI00301BBB9B